MHSSDMAASIGTIVVNLRSLEFVMRLFLYEAQRAPGAPPATSSGVENHAVGQWVPENPLTNYDTLGQVIKKLNSELQARGLDDRVDESVAELRDTLAHGRVLANQPDGPFRILKFSKPCNGKVQVKVSVEMTPDWLAKQVERTNSELQKVVKLGRALGLSCFPDP